MNSTSVDKIIDEKLKKVKMLQDRTTFLQCKYNIREELMDLSKNVIDIEKDISEIKKMQIKADQLTQSFEQQLKQFQNFEDSYCRVNESSQLQNVIQLLHTSKAITLKSTEIQSTMESESNLQNNNQTVTNKTEKVTEKTSMRATATIDLIVKDEFNSIPKYIIGRNTLSMINNFINTLNAILIEKYEFLAQGKQMAKKKNKLSRYLDYMSQDTSVKGVKGKTVYFFTENDYQEYTQSKLDKIKLNYLTALRHVKRIEFVKIIKETYYVVLTSV